MQTKHHMTKLIKFSSKFPLWKTLKGSEIRSHYSNKYSEMLQDKWMYEIKKIDLRKKIVLAEYFEQQTDCSRYRRKISQSRKSFYLSISNRWKPCHRAINSWPGNLKTKLEKYFWFQWNCKQTPGWSKDQHCKLWDLFPNFLWNYTYNFENIFTAWS